MSYARGFTHGLALGGGVMFLLDPRQGGARRAYVRDKSIRAAHEVEGAVEIGTRDLAHRLEGTVARVFSPRRNVDDPEVVVARVRARLGHVSAHPGAIEVRSKGEGCIELKGPVLASEAESVVAAISKVPGVHEIDDDLERHATADVPALQGEHPRANPMVLKMWTPSVRLVLGAVSASVAISSLLRGHPAGFVAGGAGVLALARSIVHRNVGPRRRPRPQLTAPGGATAPSGRGEIVELGQEVTS